MLSASWELPASSSSEEQSLALSSTPHLQTAFLPNHKAEMEAAYAFVAVTLRKQKPQLLRVHFECPKYARDEERVGCV